MVFIKERLKKICYNSNLWQVGFIIEYVYFTEVIAVVYQDHLIIYSLSNY